MCKGLRTAIKAKIELAVWLPGAWLCSVALRAGRHTCCLHTTPPTLLPLPPLPLPTSPWVLEQPPAPSLTHQHPHRAQQGRVPRAPLLSPPSFPESPSPVAPQCLPSPFLPRQRLSVRLSVRTKVFATSQGDSWPKIIPGGISGAVMGQWREGDGGGDALVPLHCAQPHPAAEGWDRFGATQMEPFG